MLAWEVKARPTSKRKDEWILETRRDRKTVEFLGCTNLYINLSDLFFVLFFFLAEIHYFGNTLHHFTKILSRLPTEKNINGSCERYKCRAMELGLQKSSILPFFLAGPVFISDWLQTKNQDDQSICNTREYTSGLSVRYNSWLWNVKINAKLTPNCQLR